MSTLLLRLAAPLQSWGLDKFERRGTDTIPTKSGVIGMLAAALGRRRTECDDMQDMLSMRFGVRVERGGGLLRDYHTAKKDEKNAYVTHRYYLSDAVFLIGLEGSVTFLEELAHALQNPIFPLFLGRCSCPPEGKVFLKIAEGKNLLSALTEEPSIIPNDNPDTSKRRIVIDADADNEGSYIRDVPLSFNQNHRKYGFRRAYEVRRTVPEHNPMQELDEFEE